MPLSTAAAGRGDAVGDCAAGLPADCPHSAVGATAAARQASHAQAEPLAVCAATKQASSPRRRSMANRSNSSMAISPPGRSAYILSATLERWTAEAGCASGAALGRPTAPAARKVLILRGWWLQPSYGPCYCCCAAAVVRAGAACRRLAVAAAHSAGTALLAGEYQSSLAGGERLMQLAQSRREPDSKGLNGESGAGASMCEERHWLAAMLH